MTVSYKPPEHPSVAPYLIIDDAARTIAFLTEAFDGREIRRFEREGRIAHAEVRIDDSVVMLGDSFDGWPAVASHVHLYVPDVDAAYARALAAGATSMQEPDRRGDEDRRGGVRDPGGTTWWISTRQAD